MKQMLQPPVITITNANQAYSRVIHSEAQYTDITQYRGTIIKPVAYVHICDILLKQ